MISSSTTRRKLLADMSRSLQDRISADRQFYELSPKTLGQHTIFYRPDKGDISKRTYRLTAKEHRENISIGLFYRPFRVGHLIWRNPGERFEPRRHQQA